MTISYSGNFCRLLLRWKGSLFRSVWRELLVYIVLFYLVKLFYVVGIDHLTSDEQERENYRRKFEALCRMFNEYTKLIPLTFLLGFYVSNVVTRWWRQFESLSWPEDLLSLLCLAVPGEDEVSQKRRHCVARYINLSTALVWRDVSKKIRLRFPTVSSLMEAGLVTEKEFEKLETLQEDCATIRWMAPLHWIQQIVEQDRKEHEPPVAYVNNFYTELKIFRQSLRRLYAYDWVCVPLVYTQVAALATYSFFFFSLFGRQALHPEVEQGKQIDTVLPVFTIFQFMFFVGWFKVGQDLMRPFGLDDDDIELNYLLDRNFQTSFAIVNRLQTSNFEAEEDRLWLNREGKMEPLPHSPYSRELVEHQPKLHSFIALDDEDKTATCITSMRRKRHIYW